MAVDPADVRIMSAPTARSTATLRRAPAAPTRGKVPGFWIPAWAPPQCAVTAPSAADALRCAIYAACREARMPVSQQELRWWIAAQPQESWWRRELSPTRTGAALRNVALRDRHREGEPEAVRVVEGPLTCHGGAPKRYVVGAMSEVEIRACHITDAVTTLQLDVELETRATLLPLGLPSGARRQLERARLTAVRAALMTYCGPLDSRELARAHRRRARAMRAVTSWHAAANRAETAAITLRSNQRQEQARWRATKMIVRHLETHATKTSSRLVRAEPPAIVGCVALLSPERAVHYVERTKASGQIAATRPELVYATARRFPRPRVSSRDAKRSARLVVGDELALLDAVDVWCAVQRRAGSEETMSTTALTGIIAVVGPVLRDAVLIDALKVRPDLSGDTRRLLTRLSALLSGRLPTKVRKGARTRILRAYPGDP